MSIVAKNLFKVVGQPPTRILNDISLEIREGEFVALTGRSGSGKSTLLYLLSTLDYASSGALEIEGQNVMAMDPPRLSHLRNQQIGFVFQFHYLLDELSALENVLLPARKAGRLDEREGYAKSLLEQFGLGDKLHRLPRQLSGGEQQRVAIARSLVMQPKYLFADEPTGSLDSANGELVMKLLREANEQRGTTLVLVTHDADFAKQAKRQIHLVDGAVISSTQMRS